MKKTVRILSAIMLVLICAGMFQVTSCASDASDDLVDYVVSCSSSSDGKHHMIGRSTCWAKNVNTGEKREGQGAQCRYCHMLLVSQNNLFLNPYQGMGWFATRSAWADEGRCFTIEVTGFSTNSSHRDQIGQQFVWDLLTR